MLAKGGAARCQSPAQRGRGSKRGIEARWAMEPGGGVAEVERVGRLNY